MKRYHVKTACIHATAWLAMLLTVFWIGPALSIADEPAKLSAVVGASEGEITVLRDQAQDETKLGAGDIVNLWDTVNTRDRGKILLRWDNGLLTSLGAFSSLALTWGEPHGKPAPVLQIPEGIVRFAPRTADERPPLYVVTTATASIEPSVSDQGTDFIVETYEPSTTVVTVIAGRLKIKNLRKDDAKETEVRACQTAYVDENKSAIEVLPGTADALRKLVDASTIQGTIVANLDVCPAPVAKEEPPAAEPEEAVPSTPPVAVIPQPYWTGTYVEPWPFYDEWFDGITVGPCSWLPGRILVNIPCFGQIVVGVPAYGPWACNPAVITPFVRHWLYRHAWYWQRRWNDDWRLRRREAFGLIHVAQSMHDPRLWWRARRELDFLRTRSRWGGHRIRDFEHRMHGLEGRQKHVRWRIPAGVDLQRAVDESFRAPQNAATLRNIQQRLREDTVLQNRLTRASAQETTGLATRIGRERDPSARFAMRRDLVNMETRLNNGSVPISKQQQQIGTLVNRLGSTSDPRAHEQLRQQLGRDLSRLDSSRTTTLLNQERLASLRDATPANLSPAARRRFDRGITNLERSVQTRVRTEKQAQQYRNLIDRAAGVRNSGRSGKSLSSTQKLQNRVPETLGLVNRLPSATDAQNGLRAMRSRLQRDSLRALRGSAYQRSGQFQGAGIGSDARRRWHADRQNEVTARRQQLNRLRVPQSSNFLRQQRSSNRNIARSLPQMLQRFGRGSVNSGTRNQYRSNRSSRSIPSQSQIQKGFRALNRNFSQPSRQRQFKQPQRSQRNFRQHSFQSRRNTGVRRQSFSRQSARSSIGSHLGRSRSPSRSHGSHRRR